MNALSLPRSRGTSAARRVRPIPRRREAARQANDPRDPGWKEMYIETARLTRWTR